MRKGVGVICLILGVLLILEGHDVASSLASQVKQAFAGVPMDAAVRLYLAGIGTGLF